MKSLRRKVWLSESLFPHKKKLMTGGNVTEDWRKASNKSIADNLIKSIEELLDGKVSHYVCCDRTTQHEKIVIEYNHTKK